VAASADQSREPHLDLTVVGEALLDIELPAAGGDPDLLAMAGRAGGSPANVAVGLARLGIATHFAGRIAQDPVGAFIRRHLEASGVDLTRCTPASEPATLAMFGVDGAGVASYSFHVEGTADWQWKPSELFSPPSPAVVHTGSLALALEPGAGVITAWVRKLRERGDVFVSLDPNVRPAMVAERDRYHDRVESLVSLAQLVKASDEDLLLLDPQTPALETAKRWAAGGPELVVVTHGADGVTAVRAGAAPLHREAEPVAIVDTVGAGDSFTSALLAFFAQRDALGSAFGAALDPETVAGALEFAARAAAFTCGRAGADPPWTGDL